MILRADLHLHSCLSPCGDLLMSPAAIVETLVKKNIGLAALTDHNTALNCPAFSLLCRKAGIGALYGMEAQTTEEIHALCLFSVLADALDFCKKWYDLLPPVMNIPERTGDQVYVSETDEILGEVEKYLIISAPVSLDALALEVHRCGGLIIPAHVDRPAFSMTSQLGVIVKGPWDALEFVRPQCLSEKKTGAAGILPAPYPVTTSSDAHYIEHIGRRAFDLNIGTFPLFDESGNVNLAAVRAGLAKRVVTP
ncbi:MAG: PHP domain-containing protein [Treponema sp.]|nr:PHP domain-containing protein [Treponema sp.]